MIRKLLYFVRSLFLNFNFSSKEGSLAFISLFEKMTGSKTVLDGKVKYLFILLFSVFANSVSGQITQPTAWTKAYDQTTLACTGTNFAIAAGSNRLLVVAIATTYTNAGGDGTQVAPTTITYGGVTLTSATENGTTSGRMHTWLYYLKDNVVMDATSRALNVTGAAVVNSALANMTVWYGVFAGVDQVSTTYTVGNGFANNSPTGATAKLSAAMTVNTNEQAIYISNVYNESTAINPSYTINTNWTSGGANTGSNGFNTAWKIEVAKRSIPGSNTTDLATTSAITPNGSIRFAMSAMSLPRAIPPAITSFSPTSGCASAGTSVVLTGTNFTGATAVKFNNVSASFTVNSSTQITATLPSTATTGQITVTNANGTATSASVFTVATAPPTTSNAGIDQSGNSSFFILAANNPTVGTGVWSIVSGPSLATSQFVSLTDPTTTFNRAVAGTYVLRWTISNSCGTSTDDVVIANCSGNLISNGDFTNSTAGNNTALNWTKATTMGSLVETQTENTYFATGNTIGFTAELDSQSSLGQTVAFVPGVSYTVSFIYAQRPGAPTPTDVTVKVTGGTAITSSPFYTSVQTPTVGSFTFTATSSSTAIEFYNSSNGGLTYGTIIDNIVLIPTSQVAPIAGTSGGSFNTSTSCAGVPVQLNVKNVPTSGVYTYSWTGSPGASFSSLTSPSPTVTFTGSGYQQATVTVTTAGGCQSDPSTTYVYVNAVPTITTAATPAVVTAVCQGVTTTAMPYTATTNSPTSYSIDWATLTDQVSTTFNFLAGGGTLTGISIPAGTVAGTYTGTMTIKNANGCTGTLAITMTVNPNLAASVSIAASPSGAICAGTPVTFTATPTFGGTTPTYQWYNGLTAVGTGSTYSSSTLANGAAIKVVMTSNASPCLTGSPATSNTITMTVNPNLSAVGITPTTAQSICGLNSGTLLTAAETGGNGVTLRQWGKRSVSGGTITNITGQNGPTFTPTGTNLGNGNWLIVCTSTPSCGTAMVSNEVSVSVNPDLAASVSIAASPSGAICAGTPVTFTATPVNGGTTPTYQWYNGLTAVGTGSTYSSSTLANGAAIKVVMTSNASPCLTGSPATSNTITMTVNPNLSAVGITPNTAQSICGLNSGTLLTAAETGGNGVTLRQWGKRSVSGGTITNITGQNGPTFTPTGTNLGNGNWLIVCTSTPSCGTAMVSNEVSVSVNPDLAASVSIAASPSGAICAGTPVTFTATPVNGGTTPTYQWYNGLTAVGTGSTYSSSTLANGAAIKVVMTSNASPCLTGSPATSNTITMTVNPTLSAVAITPNGGQALCAIGTGTLLTVAETGGNTITSRQWGKRLVSGGAITNISGQNAQTFTPTGANLGVGDWLIVCTSTPSCGSAIVSNEVSVKVSPDIVASVTILASPSGTICSGTLVTFTATPINGGTAPTYQWYNGLTPVGTGLSTYSSSTLVNADDIKVVMTSNATPCLAGSPATSNTITMSVNALPGTPSPGTPVQPTCASPVGSVLLGNLPSTGTWTITQSGFASGTYPGTGSTYNVQNLAPGNYTFTVVGAANSCSSLASTNVTINAPTSKVWTGNADANWSNPANWNPAVTPSASDCIVIPDLTAVPNIPSIQGTGVVANAYTITVSDKASLTVNSKNTLRVVGSVTVAPLGSLVFQDQASLVQTTNATNTGNITYNRNTDLVRRYDFTYWSTPITNTASPYKLSDLSPNTLLDKYTSYNSPASSWDIYLNGLKDMEPAVGYSVRAPQSFSLTVPAIYPAVFTGVPNNGDYSVPIYAAKWSLVGNPYPSAIDAEEFININHFASPSVDVGALYFWTHNSPPSSTPSPGGSYDYTSNDYAVFTLSGSTRTGAKRPDGTYDPAPTGQIASCQSFFMLASVPGIVKFTNDMRIDGGNDQFYKTTKSKAIEKNRVWLNLTSNKGAFKQILVGYIEGATNEWDVNFDATANNGNSFIDFYSINESEKLAIQGRALPFADTDRIPLGYKTTVAGDFIIEIDRVDGLFNNQAVYLEDRVTGKVTDLKAGNYTFTTAIGTFADRFTIVYTKKTLGAGDFENLENSVFVSIKEETIKVTSTKETIKEITIYDINGQLLYNKKKIGVNELQIPNLQSSNQVLLVKVTLDNDFTTTKKIIFQ